jgi:hypothetical protein
MIEIRPLKPVHTVGDQDTLIAKFADFEWRDLIELAQQYGFKPPDTENYLPLLNDDALEIDAETSQGLWEAMSTVYYADAVPPGVPSALGKLWVKQLMGCAQVGAEQGGIEIRRSRDVG